MAVTDGRIADSTVKENSEYPEPTKNPHGGQITFSKENIWEI